MIELFRKTTFIIHEGSVARSQQSVADDLLDLKLPDRDVASPFHQRAVEERMTKYSHAAISSTVRDELGSIEEKMGSVSSSFHQKLNTVTQF